MSYPPDPAGVPKAFLHKGKEDVLRRKHPWIFSGAIARIDAPVKDGDVVAVFNARNAFEALGHYTDGSIKIRILSYQQAPIDLLFWEQRLREAYDLRKALGLTDTNAYRLVHGEGDYLPGLVIDIYNQVAVVQAHSIGMHRGITEISQALQTVMAGNLLAVYDKSKETLPAGYAQTITNGYLFGALTLPHQVTEYGQHFFVDWESGQKTGFFLDQRENRQLLAHYAPGKTVLNAFCYSGGFSVYALNAGAAAVHSMDISQKAMALCNANVALNSGNERHQDSTEDVMKWLKTCDHHYDIVVLDPPAFAKGMTARHRAVQGYKRLNAEGLKRVKPGGLLFTFSCSQVVDRELFYHTAVAAALEAGRSVRVLHHLTQGADHPVNMFHPEGNYLKGLVLRVDD